MNNAQHPRDEPGGPESEDLVEIVVEIPRGSRNKYEEAEDGRIWFDRKFGGPVGFPGDYGYVAGFKGEDGDNLDALVLLQEATYPGVHMWCRVLGAFVLDIGGDEETKLICVPHGDGDSEHLADLSDLPGSFIEELDAFFLAYRMLEPGGIQVRRHVDRVSTLTWLRR